MAEQERLDISIYQYDNFRQFLKDRYDARKHTESSFSARAFAAEAGFSNPGYFNDVIKGRRRLSKSAEQKLAAVFHLSPTEKEYFALLVTYSQAKNDTVRQQAYRKILFRRSRSAFTRLNPALTRYYQDYRYPLIRSAIMASDFRGDYQALGTFLYPPLAPSQVKKYVRDLCNWKMVYQDESGRYRVTEAFVEPSPTLMEHVRQIHRDWISHAMDALMSLPPKKRNISSMLCACTPETAKKIDRKIERTREEIWKLLQEETEEPGMVMQLNIQFFPRSRRGGQA